MSKAKQQPRHASLQIALIEWLRHDTDRFTKCVRDREVGMESFILTIDDVAMHMATAALETYETIRAVTADVGHDV